MISHSDIMIRIGIVETVGEPLREPTLRVITRTSFLKLLEPLGALGRVPEPRCSAWGFVGSLFAGSFTITAVLGALGPNQPNGLTKPKKEEASFATCIGAAARSARLLQLRWTEETNLSPGCPRLSDMSDVSGEGVAGIWLVSDG